MNSPQKRNKLLLQMSPAEVGATAATFAAHLHLGSFATLVGIAIVPKGFLWQQYFILNFFYAALYF